MLRVYKSTIKLSALAAIALLFTGCGESKVAQCNKVIKIANDAALLGQQYGKDPKTAKGTQGLTQLASKIDQVGTDMKGLEIKDEKLQGYQGRFIKLYQDISKGLNDTATAINKKDIKQANSFLITLQKSSVEEGLIVKEINGYCTGK